MKDWHKVLIGPDSNIKEAIELLDKEAQRIVLVVDEKRKLLGTITDGDIRRGLLRHITMEASASHVMCKTPRTAADNDDRKKTLSMMKSNDLLQIPIINDEGVVVGLESLQQLIIEEHYENPVFLMAGGFGKRLHPLTIETPKPMLKVGDKPILQNTLESFISQGFRKFYISTHYKAEMVQKHFGNGDRWGVSIEYIREEKPLGTAGALGLLPRDKFSLPAIMMNGDLMTNINYGHLLEYHSETGGIATMCVRKYDFQVPFGVVTTNDDSVNKIIEKPVHNFFVNAGIYVINPELLDYTRVNEYQDMPDLLNEQIAVGNTVNMFPLHEYWIDIGRADDLERAETDVHSL